MPEISNQMVFVNGKHPWALFRLTLVLIDLFTDTAAILNSIVSNSYYGMLRW